MGDDEARTATLAPERHAAPMPLGEQTADARQFAALLSICTCLDRRATHPTHGTPDDIARAVFINSHRFRATSSFDGKVWRLSRKHNESGNAREANE